MRPPAHALILAAGLGTRLQPLSQSRAKPAIPVGGEPLVRRIVGWLAGQGVNDIVVNLHHLPSTITATLGDGADLGARIRYSWEQPVVLGSAGGPRQALDVIGAETFLIVNGDTLTDVDLERLAGDHRSSGALVTLALTPNREPLRYNGVRLGPERRVTAFVPRGPAADGSYHLVGVQIVQASAFRPLTPGQPADSIRGLYDRMIDEQPGTVRGWVSEAAFWDVGTVADYWRTSQAFLEKAADGNSCGRGVQIDPTAEVRRSILWDDVRVGAHAVLDECVVADGVRVPANRSFRRVSLVNAGETLTVTPWETGAAGQR